MCFGGGGGGGGMPASAGVRDPSLNGILAAYNATQGVGSGTVVKATPSATAAPATATPSGTFLTGDLKRKNTSAPGLGQVNNMLTNRVGTTLLGQAG